MKQFVRAAFALSAFGLAAAGASPALASDLPRRAESPALLPAKAPGVLPFNWGGLYAGLNVGGGFGDVSGVLVGGQVGYNWQIGRVVFGAETDIQWSGQDKTSTIGALAAKQELNWFGTLRGRVGYTVWDRWLPYFTGGLAYGGRNVTVGPFSASDTTVGWALGFGVDYAINPLLSARLEYLHVSLDSFNATVPGIVPAGRLDNDIIRGAINYKLLPSW